LKNYGRECFLEDNSKREEILKNYYATCDNNYKQSGILFIVSGGNFSEGFNFGNNYCRAIFMIGVPFAPYKTPY